MRTINTEKAEARGYRAVTINYQLPREQDMLDAVRADMRRGSIDHVLVRDPDGVSVWRRGASRAAGNPRAEIRNPKGRSLVTSAATRAWRVAA